MKLLDAKEIAARYGVSERTARRYMHEMGCWIVKPLRVTMKAVIAWENIRKGEPIDYRKAIREAELKSQLLMRTKVRERLNENREVGARKRQACSCR